MRNEKSKPTDAERELLLDALEQFSKKGKTDIKCPRCGNSLKITMSASASEIECLSESCISMGLRGL
jgi:hypothetical protein